MNIKFVWEKDALLRLIPISLCSWGFAGIYYWLAGIAPGNECIWFAVPIALLGALPIGCIIWTVLHQKEVRSEQAR